MASAVLASRQSSVFLRGGVPASSSCPSSSSGVVFSSAFRHNYSVGAIPSKSCSRKGDGNAPFFVRGGSSQGFAALYGFSSPPPGFSQRVRLGRKASSFSLKEFSPTSEDERGGGRVRAHSRDRGFSARASDDNENESRRITLPIIGELPFEVPDLGEITAKKVAIWTVLAALVYSILNLVASRTVFNPKFWTYASWILVVWPIPAAILLGVMTLVTAYRVRKRKPKEWEQVLMLLGSLIWLILVPLGTFQGFVDGWPLLLFSLYVAFFLISALVRYQLYGDLSSKAEDKQWENTTSRSWQIGFVLSLVAGHWLAALEAPFLALSWNFGRRSQLAAAVLALAVITHYTAAYYLGKYFDRLVRPRAVVMFGPYRWVRHPIYASYMLLFMGYCLALRSYKSLVFLLAACIAYYEQRTNIEEEQLVDTFGELYSSYAKRVQNKYFPLLY